MVRFADFGRFDPLPAFRFRLSFNGVVIGHFAEVRGMAMETESIDYREGGEPTIMRKIPGLTNSGDITLRRGLSNSMDLALWYGQIFSVPGFTDILPDPLFQRVLNLDVLQRGGLTAMAYTIFGCWPKRYTPGDFDAKANEIAMEEVVLANQGFLPTQNPGGIALTTPSLF